MVSLGVIGVSFLVLVFGIGPAWIPARLGKPLVRVAVGIAASLVAIYLASFAIYVADLPRGAHWLLGLLPVATLVWRRRELVALWSDRDVRHALRAWSAVAAWLLGWQFCVYSYSGATWQADWQEHFDRARFFLGHWDLSHRFLGAYSVAARPPLVNLVSCAFLALVTNKFFVYQACCCLLASLVVWPALLLQQRFARPGTTPRAAWLVLFLLALPMLAQNAAFTWTKLPAAFFILVGIALLSERAAEIPTRLAGWLTLTAAMLAHYSAGPWILALGVALWAREPSAWRNLFRRSALVIGAACALLFATWIGWSVARLGVAETFGSNSTVMDAAGMGWQKRLGNVGENLVNTTVPVLLRHVDYGGYMPGDALVLVRDEYFNSVQSSSLMIAGSLGVVIAGVLLWRRRNDWFAPTARFWGCLVSIGMVLGIAVHTEVIDLGVAHVCLQPFALIVVAWLAARLPGNPTLQVVHGIGLACDVLLGIVAHFVVQGLWLQRLTAPGRSDEAIIDTFAHAARMNLLGRNRIGEPFLYDLPSARFVTVALLCLAVVLVVQAFRRPAVAAERNDSARVRNRDTSELPNPLHPPGLHG